MFMALVDIAGLVGLGIGLSSEITSAKAASYSYTTVEIGAGIGESGSGDLGGRAPAIALWNRDGGRLGQWMDTKKSIDSGTSAVIHVAQDQGHEGQPEYIQLTTVDDDAICITYVSVAGNGVAWNWMGDIGYHCGGDWYPSKSKLGSANYQPKCTWIDKNHSNDLRFIAMSMHMPDFNADPGLLAEYQSRPEALCRAKARFMLWGELNITPGYNSVPPMFKPPLQYHDDGADKDYSALFKPGFNDMGLSKRDGFSASNSTFSRRGHIKRTDHVVISDYPAHDAAEVCDSDTSRGPSFISTTSGIYCDMSTKTKYPLCNDTTQSDCFDLGSKSLVGPARKHPRGLTARFLHKRYASSEQWTPEEA